MLDYSPRVKPRFWGLFSGRSLCVPQWIFSLRISLAEAKFYVRVFSPLSVGLFSQFLTFTLKEQFAFFPVGLKGNSCSFFSPFGLLRSFSALPFGLLRSVFVFPIFGLKGLFTFSYSRSSLPFPLRVPSPLSRPGRLLYKPCQVGAVLCLGCLLGSSVNLNSTNSPP